MAHSGKPEEDLPKPIVDQGHPLDPNRGVLMSEDDEKRMDEQGRPIVDGLLWSKAASGAYMFVTASREFIGSNSHTLIGASCIEKGLGGIKLTIGCTIGAPSFSVHTAGACLEIPTDLGRDDIKQSYIAQWLAHTSAEALALMGVNLGGDPILAARCAQDVAVAGNRAINALGF